MPNKIKEYLPWKKIIASIQILNTREKSSPMTEQKKKPEQFQTATAAASHYTCQDIRTE
jgi:hypothetical protein